MQIVAGDHFSKLWIIICNMMSSIHLFANVCGGSISLQSVVMDAFVTILCCRAFLKTSLSGLFQYTNGDYYQYQYQYSGIKFKQIVADGRDRFFQIIVGKLFGEL